MYVHVSGFSVPSYYIRIPRKYQGSSKVQQVLQGVHDPWPVFHASSYMFNVQTFSCLVHYSIFSDCDSDAFVVHLDKLQKYTNVG